MGVRSTMAGIVPVTVLLSGIGFLVSQAAAQQAMTVPELRACACEGQTLATLRQRNDAARALYDERTQREQRLTQQIDQLQATMTPGDLSAQDQLRELLDLRARVAQERRDNALPAWQQSTRRLNEVVADYNAKCANRPIYKTDDEEARKGLVCPITP